VVPTAQGPRDQRRLGRRAGAVDQAPVAGYRWSFLHKLLSAIFLGGCVDFASLKFSHHSHSFEPPPTPSTPLTVFSLGGMRDHRCLPGSAPASRTGRPLSLAAGSPATALAGRRRPPSPASGEPASPAQGARPPARPPAHPCAPREGERKVALCAPPWFFVSLFPSSRPQWVPAILLPNKMFWELLNLPICKRPSHL